MHAHMRLLCLCTERLSCIHWLSHCGWLLSSEIFIYLDSPVLTFPSFSIQPAALTIDEGTVACLPKSYWRQPPNPEALVLILEHLPHCQDRSRTQGAHVVCALWIIMIWPWKSGWTLKIVWCLHSKTAYCVCLFTVTLTMRLTDLLSQAQLSATGVKSAEPNTVSLSRPFWRRDPELVHSTKSTVWLDILENKILCIVSRSLIMIFILSLAYKRMVFWLSPLHTNAACVFYIVLLQSLLTSSHWAFPSSLLLSCHVYT